MAQAHVIPEPISEPISRVIPRPDRTVGIVGTSDSTGFGIAQAARRRGFHVRLVEAHRAAELVGAHLVVDASSDLSGDKLETLRNLDAVLGRDTVIVTHTSGTSVTKLARAAKRPERVVGLHLMQPAATAELAEIVRALQTSDETHDEACRFVRALGKTVVSVKDSPGFLVHRLHVPMINEACFVLQEGLASAEDIDAAAPLASGMGPLRMADEIGLDQCLFATERLHREFGDSKYRPSQILRNYVAAGWLGRKTGRGFYTYT